MNARAYSTPPMTPETLQRLVWCYGPSRAASIRRGADQAYNADIAAWRRLFEKADKPRWRERG